MRRLTDIAIVVASFLLGAFLGRRSVEVATTTIVRVDTVFYEKPQPIGTTLAGTVTARVPRLLFAPGETIVNTVVVSAADSIDVQVAIEQKEYGDSTYRAQVSGPRVGEYGPTLDWIETYNRTVTRTTTIRDPYKWELGPAAGAWYADSGGSAWIGGQVRRNFGRLNLTASGGWDSKNEGAFVQATLGVTLWRK
ncbi:DUF6808 domain-containing protein [Alistipes finegoldii]|jgi:hypothetical protein|uniref:DUF6808 domain-containing protein n=1 Tax=Alistipes finegoldii TaxID=214856 RepID=UPI00204D1ED6|nr:MAG TPA: hypothetical protein [Caudoviricetes sp.]